MHNSAISVATRVSLPGTKPMQSSPRDVQTQRPPVHCIYIVKRSLSFVVVVLIVVVIVVLLFF